MTTPPSPPCPACAGPTAPGGRRLAGFELHVCALCGLRFAPGAWDAPADYDRVWETPEYLASVTAPLRAERDPGRAFARWATYRPFFRALGDGRGRRLLDVGCGVGSFCHAAAARGWDVQGIDVSATAVEAGRPLARFPLRQARLEDVVASGERWDAASAFEVLEHLRAPVDFLRLLARVVKPGGRVFVTVPNGEAPSVREATRVDWLPPIHVNFFSRRALVRAAESAGLRGVRAGFVFEGPPRRPLAAARWAAGVLRRGPDLPGLWLAART